MYGLWVGVSIYVCLDVFVCIVSKYVFKHMDIDMYAATSNGE